MIPCKRPRVTVDQRVDRDAFDVNCRVPGCDFTYPRDKTFVALKSDAESTAARHRQEHRVAVPRIETKVLDSGREAEQCQHCGWVTTSHTKTDRRAQVDYHLSSHHGLVSC